jgi:hypothetical protein
MNCTGTTRTGFPCVRRATRGFHCWQHAPPQDDVHPVFEDNLCISMRANGVLCSRRARFDGRCLQHHRLHTFGQIDLAQPMGDLARLANDVQNVHTAVVSEQMNRGLDKLLAQAVPSRQNSLTLLGAKSPSHVARALKCGEVEAKKVIRDVRSWYVKTLCRDTNDFLYRRCLDGLVVLISASPHYQELAVRFWEEARDATGMCCEGHLSRLTNVLVGFDPDVSPPVPVGEILQQKMSAIAATEDAVETKVGKAWTLFLELGIPMNERLEWLEAL